MKTITQLKGIVVETEHREPRGVLQTIHLEPVKGFFLRLTLGSAGLVVSNPAGRVAYPIAELVRLAQEHEPALRPGESKPLEKEVLPEEAKRLANKTEKK